MRWQWAAVWLILIAAGGCKKTVITGPVHDNLPPETHTVVDTIIRVGPDRLNSEVHIRWWGDDPDGFVTGYEFTFDDPASASWTFTTANDSVFLLAPPPGQDTMDFTFTVRAVDNLGLRDPSPASLTYPVKNSPPVVQFIQGANEPVKSFPVLRYLWVGSDPDGQANLDHYEIAWNDTAQVQLTLPVTVTALTVEATDPKADTSSMRVYLNNNDNPEPGLLHGLRMNDTNRLYIRLIDNSGSASPWAGSMPVYVRKQYSDILLVNAYTSGIAQLEQFYAQGPAGQGITLFDTLRIFEQANGAFTQLSADNPTQSKVFRLFKTIIWFGNNAENSLSLAQKTTGDFFNQGGKMFMAVYVSSAFDQQSQFLDFTPATSLVDPADTTLILNNNALILPGVNGWPTLKSTGIVGVVKPMNIALGSTSLYDAELLAKDNATSNLSPWTGVSTVIAARQNAGQTNFIMSNLELQGLNGNNNIDSLFQAILIGEFGL